MLLYENLFRFYAYPAVYVIFLPAIGLLFDIAAAMSKRPVFIYKAAVYAGVWGIAAIACGGWLYHVFVAGMPDWLRTGMMIVSMLQWVPMGVMLVSLAGTLCRGVTFNVAMMYAAASVLFIVLGNLTGIPLSMTSITVQLAPTSVVYAQFHFIIGLFATFAVFAAVYFWFPKMTGRSADSTIAKIAFWLSLAGTQVTFWPLFIIGMQGMPRRYFDYVMHPQFEFWHHIATYGAFMTGAGILLMAAGWVYSAIAGPETNGNPWGSKSLEWTPYNYT